MNRYKFHESLLVGAVMCFLVAAIVLYLMAGCSAEVQLTTKAAASEEQHTGPGTVAEISVCYCLPAQGEKSGTSVCDRTLTLKSDSGAVYQIGLERSGSWPPVWKGMRADIHFRPCENCYPPG